MTNREMELFRIAIHYAMLFEDSNPEVGMGPTKETVAKRIATELSFLIDDDDIDECCEYVYGS